ncbi:glycosyltransferase family 2 protein [Haloarcula marismortui]|uniref:glycosyltransferase family 2 protein n=1 Tax=Haloarcula marismortui TaxID=2238 RepID=UPI003C7227D7
MANSIVSLGLNSVVIYPNVIMGAPTVGVVVVSWNSKDETISCLQSVLGSVEVNIEIAVVDNNSTDGTVDLIRSQFPDVEVIENNSNVGFGHACNQGMNYHLERGVDFLFLLNSDLYVGESTIRDLVNSTTQVEDFGMITPVVHYKNDKDSPIWFKRGHINWATSTSFHESHSVPLVHSISQNSLSREDQFLENDYIPLCSALIDPNAVKEIGEIPEEYFLYYEDVDYCTQFIENGWKVLTDTEIQVYHDESASSGGRTSPTATYYNTRNHILFLRRFSCKLNIFIAIAWSIVWFTTLLAYRLSKQNLEAGKALLEGILDGVLNRTGKGRYP